jgi:hypothetical protein
MKNQGANTPDNCFNSINDELSKDLNAFESILSFYASFSKKILETIEYAKSYSKNLPEGSNENKEWNQLGDSLWQIIPSLEDELEKSYKLKECLELCDKEKEEEFYISFNQVLMKLALAIKFRKIIETIKKDSEEKKINYPITQRLVELQNLMIRSDHTHPIKTINDEIIASES